MSAYAYYPSRPAPTPPCWPRPCDELPADHPFLNPYTPPQLSHTSSCSSLDSVYSIHTPPATPPHYSRPPRPYVNSPATGSYPSSLSHSPHSPSSWLAAPLSPARSILGHPNISRPKPSYPSNYSATPTAFPSSPAFIPLPNELSLFDTRPKNLLADLEFIAGKKLHFPFLHRRKGSQDKEVKVKAEKEKRASAKSEKSSSPSRLTKERRLSEEQEYIREAAALREEMMRSASRRGRGVREGNWI